MSMYKYYNSTKYAGVGDLILRKEGIPLYIDKIRRFEATGNPYVYRLKFFDQNVDSLEYTHGELKERIEYMGWKHFRVYK